MGKENINWGHLAHMIGDMHDEEEYTPVVVCMPDGSLMGVVGLERKGDGWRLILSTSSQSSDA